MQEGCLYTDYETGSVCITEDVEVTKVCKIVLLNYTDKNK